jgi:SAM-dependent MidA family methyltransferase
MGALKRHIEKLIRLEGPIPVDRYMQLCLGHPSLGYYVTRDPFGAAGDFTTAPEISQMFGELLGLWAGQVWLDLGAPSPFRLIEVGPGRGTLLKDALRALRRALPSMLAAVEIVMVETSPVLRAAQQASLGSAGHSIVWLEEVGEALPADMPVILLANELLDALPVKQFVAGSRGWHERLVGLNDEGRLAFGLAPEPSPGIARAALPGSILEAPLASDALIGVVGRHLAQRGGAALFIDYGPSEAGLGDTLQAMKGHRFHDPLEDPGEADLTTHVNFARAAMLARQAGARSFGPVAQGDFLMRLGLGQRAETLKRKAEKDDAGEIDEAVRRLTDPGERGMGQLFKALAISHRGIVQLPGFDDAGAYDL